MSEQYQRAKDVFLAACDLGPTERAALLEEKCGADSDLRAEVKSLLTHYDGRTESFDASSHTATSKPPAFPPERIGHYRIVREIGKGGMGVVYEAEQDNPKRTVALKVINAGIASSSRLARFFHETEVLGKLQHPGIAQIYEAGTFDVGAGEQPYFAMELIRGQPLNQYATINDLSTRQRLFLLAGIGDAVQHAHQRGVIHRDLKPNNILVDQSGQPRVLDFGVSRATDGDIQTTTLRTNIGQLIGTIPYMSPEQAGGDPDELDTRSDVYALGVVAYELLAGGRTRVCSSCVTHWTDRTRSSPSRRNRPG